MPQAQPAGDTVALLGPCSCVHVTSQVNDNGAMQFAENIFRKMVQWHGQAVYLSGADIGCQIAEHPSSSLALAATC